MIYMITLNKLILSDVISVLGDRISDIAFLTLAYQLTRSPILVSIIVVIRGISCLIGSLLTSIWLDSFSNKKFLLIILDILRALLLAFCFIIKNIQILYLIIFSLSLISSIYQPIKLSAYQIFIHSNERVKAISTQQTLLQMTSILSPIIAVTLIALTNIYMAFYVDAGTFLMAALCIYFIPSWRTQFLSTDGTILRRITSGFSLIISNSIQRNILYFRLVILSTLALYDLAYVYQITTFANHDTNFLNYENLIGLFSMLGSIGITLGAVISYNIFTIKKINQMFHYGVFCTFLGCLIWASSPLSGVYLLLIYSMGTLFIFIGISFLRISLTTSGQELTDKKNFVKIVSSADALARMWQYGTGIIYVTIINMIGIQKLLFGFSLFSLGSICFSNKISKDLLNKVSNFKRQEQDNLY